MALPLLILACSRASDPAGARERPTETAPVPRLTARSLRTYDAPEATQGVAVDARHFYPVANSVLAKYELASGVRVDLWEAPDPPLVRHMNSCLADGALIRCANSNYPATPMASSIESFDAATLEHAGSVSLGMMDEGSLTWFDRFADGWIAGFAHYDASGGLAYKDHTFSSIITFDAGWRRTGGWTFPASVMERLAPHAASGGALGPDGWLYLLGHDRPELYVVGRPPMGPTLVHLATIDVEAEGQAFSWAQDGTRTVYAISRPQRLVRAIEIPPVRPDDPSAARPFR